MCKVRDQLSQEGYLISGLDLLIREALDDLTIHPSCQHYNVVYGLLIDLAYLTTRGSSVTHIP